MIHRNNGKAKRKAPAIHANKLIPSLIGLIRLGYEVEQRFLDLCHTHRRVRGTDLIPPPELDTAMLLWRTMRVRHNHGDHRNNEAEKVATRAIADWTLQVNCELRGQLYVPIQWLD